MDMNKHCKYSDEPWLTFGTSCSNCRTSEDSCEAFGGADKGSTDSSSVGIAGGVVGVGCLGLVVGANVMNKKRKAGGLGVEMSQASVV